jgi:hypothetical protein
MLEGLNIPAEADFSSQGGCSAVTGGGGRYVELFPVAVELFGIFELVLRLCLAKRRNASLFSQTKKLRRKMWFSLQG